MCTYAELILCMNGFASFLPAFPLLPRCNGSMRFIHRSPPLCNPTNS